MNLKTCMCTLINRAWQSQPTKKGKGVMTKFDFSIWVMFYGPKEAPNTI